MPGIEQGSSPQQITAKSEPRILTPEPREIDLVGQQSDNLPVISSLRVESDLNSTVVITPGIQNLQAELKLNEAPINQGGNIKNIPSELSVLPRKKKKRKPSGLEKKNDNPLVIEKRKRHQENAAIAHGLIVKGKGGITVRLERVTPGKKKKRKRRNK